MSQENLSFSTLTFAPLHPLPHSLTSPTDDETKHSFIPSDFDFDALNLNNTQHDPLPTWNGLPLESADSTPYSSDFSGGWLHNTPSTTSLTSMSSVAHSQDGLFVQIPGDDYHQHSRHNSQSALPPFSSEEGTIYPMQDLYLPQQQQQHPPKLELQTQGLRTNRQRSSSRVLPYDRRQRSESISAKSEIEDEDIGALLSATSNYSLPWSATALNGGMKRMTIQHRRTSSASIAKPTPSLGRSRRSSVALRKKESIDFLSSNPAVFLSGTAEEQEDIVKQDLTQRAEVLQGLTSMSQKDKAKSMWVRRWLHLSYTWSEGHTVPRQGLYSSYSTACEDYGVQAINSASFGKAVRNAFCGIKTRRLGVRGNSKYHYVSLRPAIRVEAERLNEFADSSGQWHVNAEDGSMRFHPSGDAEIGEEVDTDDEESSPHEGSHDIKGSTPAPVRPQGMRRHTTAAISMPQIAPIYNLPGFPVPPVEIRSIPGLCDFWNSFCRHQETLISCVRTSAFEKYEISSLEFWTNLSEHEMQICQLPVTSSMIANAMAIGFNAFMSSLMEKLCSSLPSALSLKRLADNLEDIMERCLSPFDEAFSSAKIELSVRAAHLISRFLDLHKITTGLMPILADDAQVRTMIEAWGTIDVTNMADHCALTCGCHQDMLKGLLGEFQIWLVNIDGNGVLAIRRLGAWLDKVMQELQSGLRGAYLPLRALVMRTGFISSQVMRDLTIRSEGAFGLFQLVKTWIDEWVAIKALLQTALTTQGVVGMTVSIPEGGRGGFGDLSTAVPQIIFDQPQKTPRPAMI